MILKNTTTLPKILASYIQNNLLRMFWATRILELFLPLYHVNEAATEEREKDTLFSSQLFESIDGYSWHWLRELN